MFHFQISTRKTRRDDRQARQQESPQARTTMSMGRVLLFSLVGCFALAIWGLMAGPGTTLAKGKPDGNNGGGGNGQFNTQGYWAWFAVDPLGAFAPDGPDPIGSPPDVFGSELVAAGSVSQPDDPRMIINPNQTCLVSANPMTRPSALKQDAQFSTDSLDEFDACFPEDSFGTVSISADGATVQVNVHGLSKNGRGFDYRLIIDVIEIEIDGDVGPPAEMWQPLGDADGGLQPGQTATLYLGTWELAASNPNQRTKGCVATGDFAGDSEEMGTDIKVRRWTLDEQAAHDDCER